MANKRVVFDVCKLMGAVGTLVVVAATTKIVGAAAVLGERFVDGIDPKYVNRVKDAVGKLRNKKEEESK